MSPVNTHKHYHCILFSRNPVIIYPYVNAGLRGKGCRVNSYQAVFKPVLDSQAIVQFWFYQDPGVQRVFQSETVRPLIFYTAICTIKIPESLSEFAGLCCPDVSQDAVKEVMASEKR